MIHVEDLRFTYPPALPGGPDLVALDGLRFDVPRGTCLAVTGPNGCGKTTLCLSIAGLAPRLTDGQLAGRITVGGRDVQVEQPGALADLIGLVLQDPTGQLFNPTVEDEIAWGLENLGLALDEIEARTAWALEATGLSDIPRDQPPQTLSGGQQKRLALAAALALRPQVLILDEPAGGLAPAARTEMIAVLRELLTQGKVTVLFTENDPTVVTALADEVMLLEAGRIVGRGSPGAIYPALDMRRFPGITVPPAGRFAVVVNAERGLDFTCVTVEEALKQARRYPLDGATSARLDAPLSARRADPAIELDGLAFAYQPGHPVLRGLDLVIPRGQFVALTGDNGAGKTTLARHLIGLLRPTSGRVRVFDRETDGQSVGQLARRVGFAFQNPEVQIFNPTVRDEVAFGPRNLGLSGPALDAAVEEALERFGLLPIADHPPAALSFSARRMVALASIAAMNTPILVLDEPTVGLDAEGRRRVMAWLGACHREGATVVLITHNMEIAAAHAGRLLVLRQGQFVADGTPHRVFQQEEVLGESGLEPPFAVQFARAMAYPTHAANLTPQGAARDWLERLA